MIQSEQMPSTGEFEEMQVLVHLAFIHTLYAHDVYVDVHVHYAEY